MNLFKILSTGDGSIKEPSISAFLAYLIDPQEHDLAGILLEKLLLPFLPLDGSFHKLLNGSEGKHSLNTNYTYTIELEYSVYPENSLDRRKGRSDIDVLVTFVNKQDSTDCFYLAIENKTNDKSFQTGQLLRQFEGLLNKGIINDRLFYLLFAPSNSRSASDQINSLPTSNKNVAVWSEFATRIKDCAENLKINDLYLRQTLLAFCEFVKMNFKSYQEEVKSRTRREYNVRGANLESFLAIYNNMGSEDEFSRMDLKNMYERELNNKGLEPRATDNQTSTYIVNEPSRANNHANPNNPNHNLFYYTSQNGQKNNWRLKKVIAGAISPDLKVYWNDNKQKREDYLINYPCHPYSRIGHSGSERNR